MGLTFKALTLKNLKNKGKANLFVIPYFFTFANAIFGLFSVIKTLEADFISAAYFIMLAGITDMFDGRLARAFGSSSYLGMELDSLCDAVSFCFAPAILLYSWRFNQFGFLGIAILAVYLCFGLLRLAKFNTITASKTKDIGSFIGLPTTLAAFLVAQLVINYSWLSNRLFLFLKNPVGIIFFVTIVAYLMISPIRFLSFKRVGFRLSLFGGILLSIFFLFSWVQGIPFFFLLLFSYLLSCTIYYLYELLYTRLSE